MKTTFKLIFSGFLTTAILMGCTKTNDLKPIDAKVSGSLQMEIQSLANKNPIGFDLKKSQIEWIDSSYEEIDALADKWIVTLKPMKMTKEMPLDNFIELSYPNPNRNENISFYIPYGKEKEPHKTIVLKDFDNRQKVYYILEAGENETKALIQWMKDNFY